MKDLNQLLTPGDGSEHPFRWTGDPLRRFVLNVKTPQTTLKEKLAQMDYA